MHANLRATQHEERRAQKMRGLSTMEAVYDVHSHHHHHARKDWSEVLDACTPTCARHSMKKGELYDVHSHHHHHARKDWSEVLDARQPTRDTA
jgi:hypothetical protein